MDQAAIDTASSDQKPLVVAQPLELELPKKVLQHFDRSSVRLLPQQSCSLFELTSSLAKTVNVEEDLDDRKLPFAQTFEDQECIEEQDFRCSYILLSHCFADNIRGSEHFHS